jgi:MFS family permease
VLSLLAGQFRKRWSFSRVALTALATEGLLTIALAFTPWFWLAVPLWALIQGVGILFNINTGSLRQAIVPNQMLGRVLTIASVLAWSAIPLGTLLGGAIIKATGNVMLVYAGIGVLIFLIPTAFSFTALGHAERYLPRKEEQAEASVLAEGETTAV